MPIYIGDANNKAKRVTTLYTGINGKARHVIKVYVGDVNNKARLVYNYDSRDYSNIKYSYKSSALSYTKNNIVSALPYYSSAMTDKIGSNFPIWNGDKISGTFYVHCLANPNVSENIEFRIVLKAGNSTIGETFTTFSDGSIDDYKKISLPTKNLAGITQDSLFSLEISYLYGDYLTVRIEKMQVNIGNKAILDSQLADFNPSKY